MEELAAAVAANLRERGLTSSETVELTRIPGGASRETYLVEADGDRWVLRRDPPGSRSLLSQEQEWHLLCVAAVTGRVPKPITYQSSWAGGPAGVLMEFVEGTSVAPRVLRKPEYERARGVLTRQLGEALAGIHRIGPDLVDQFLDFPVDSARDQIEEWERQLDEIGEPLPAVELGLRWLRANAPDPAEPRLVHGDFRLGNFIVDEDGLAAVIDWELAHLGDPAEDIGWLCIRSWRFGNDDRPVAGVGQLDEFVSAYESAGGAPVDRDRVRYWEAFGNVKWAVICARQAHDHLTGLRRSHELASLGRRICEPEWDFLELIHKTGCSSASPAEHPRIS
jgi:aminoglycoside phosphotransferase (APT) family kinase protein